MAEKHSLLDKIKSKYILHHILEYAYIDLKSVLKLIKYNKNLLKNCDINIKDYYHYKSKEKIEKNCDDSCSFVMLVTLIEFIFIPYIIYIIMYYIHGTFNDNNLREGYDKKKKNFVDFMDNYILLPYLFFMIASYILNKILSKNTLIYLKGSIKALFFYSFFHLI